MNKYKYISSIEYIVELLLSTTNIDISHTYGIYHSSAIINILANKNISDEFKMKCYNHHTFNSSNIIIKYNICIPPEKYIMKLLHDGCDRKSILGHYVLNNEKLMIRCMYETGCKDIFECLIRDGKYNIIKIFLREVKRMLWLKYCIREKICRDMEILIYKMIG